MAPTRILTVDDEPLNLAIIEEYLSEETDYRLDSAGDGEAAWQALTGANAPYDLVILDRIMPALDGLELLRRMKGDPRFAGIPVIMQTAASTPEQVREGLAAGAYYYLTKPYEPETLCAVVRAALGDQRALRSAVNRAGSMERAFQQLSSIEFSFRTLDEARTLAEFLAGLCPNPQAALFGISELMVNAIEHGNLGISYREKTLLLMENDWHAEIGRRLELPQFRARVAHVRLEPQPDCLRFTISDAGAGFDWQRYLDFDPTRIFDPNGRGIAMAQRTSFASIEYPGCGNVVVATVSRKPS
ncbi:response regulator [Azospira restricta]|uniref:Response regulator n=1 Tax=Azospira restricta TaxID=404405 RepID=A0A974SPW1_9RHOO|nr:response regulator [Azospira restricta]QRJ64256.1 response regulator [Azospira restricta]